MVEQVTLGTKDYYIDGMQLHDDFDKLWPSKAEVLWGKHQQVYFWNCELAPHGNPPPPKYVTFETNFKPIVFGADGKIDAVKSRDALLNFADQTGLNTTKKMQDAFDEIFPVSSFKVPYKALNTPRNLFDGNHKIVVIAWAEYTLLRLQPDPPVSELLAVMVPARANFAAIVMGFCDEPPGADWRGKAASVAKRVGGPGKRDKNMARAALRHKYPTDAKREKYADEVKSDRQNHHNILAKAYTGELSDNEGD